MKTLMVFAALSITTLSNTFAGNPFSGDTAIDKSETSLSYEEALEQGSAFVQEEMSEMRLNYRFIRAFERDNHTYLLFAEDKLGQSTYVLLGVDKLTGTSFTMGVD